MKLMTSLFAAILLSTSFCGAADAPTRIPVLLDTDIGTDIDDAFALALIIKSPEFDLLGVTTVSGGAGAPRGQVPLGGGRKVAAGAGGGRASGGCATHRANALGRWLREPADSEGKRRRFYA
jgi:hypothetical protein